MIEKLYQFRGVSDFKKAVMNLLVKMLPEEDTFHLRTQFEAINKSGTGMIDANELYKFVEKWHKSRLPTLLAGQSETK